MSADPTKCLCRSTCHQQTATTTLTDNSNDDHNLEQREPSETSLDNTAARKEWGGTTQWGTKEGQDSIQKEMKHKIQTFFTTMAEKTEAELQPLHKLFQALGVNNNLDERTERLCTTCSYREFVDEHGDCSYPKNRGEP